MLKKTTLVITDRRKVTAQNTAFLKQYHPEVLDLILLYLLKKCSGLRSVMFGSDYVSFGPESWVLYLDQRPSTETSPLPPSSGRIKFIKTVEISLDQDPSFPLDPPSATDKRYVSHSLFDLSLHSDKELGRDPIHLLKWLTAFREETRLGSLHKAIDLGGLPVTLEDLGNLFTQQASTGSPSRLDTIVARQISPWQTYEFENFANIAYASLTSLVLAQSTSHESLVHTEISFDNLAAITAIVLVSLPGLSKFWFALAGGREAEATCAQMLHKRSLEHGGTILDLEIFLCGVHSRDVKTNRFFNVVRAVSGLCRPDAEINISLFAGKISSQTSALRYFRE